MISEILKNSLHCNLITVLSLNLKNNQILIVSPIEINGDWTTAVFSEFLTCSYFEWDIGLRLPAHINKPTCKTILMHFYLKINPLGIQEYSQLSIALHV